MNIVEVPFNAYGANAQLWGALDRECLVEGPRGTGKSYNVAQLIDGACETCPNTRILMARKTRKSLTESSMVTLEELVWRGRHYALSESDATRQTRQVYRYKNGSQIIPASLDQPEALKSGEYNVIWWEEGTEIEKFDTYQTMLGNLRWEQGCERRQIIVTTNPGDPNHWLNQRADKGLMRRFVTRHEDNPRLFDHAKGEWTAFGRQYIADLDTLSGVKYLRDRKGVWAGAEGMVYEDDWDPAVNLCTPADLPRNAYNDLAYTQYVGSQDWGFEAAGVFQLWGVTGDGDMDKILEVYMSHKDIDWWVAQVAPIQRDWRMKAVACDPSRPEYIQQFRKANILAVPASNDVELGLDKVRERMRKGPRGRARLRLCPDPSQERDERLAAKSLPTCTEQEIPRYVYPKGVDGKPIKEEPDPACPDHGMDAMRYAVMWVDRYHVVRREVRRFPSGSLGDLLGHEEVLKAER